MTELKRYDIIAFTDRGGSIQTKALEEPEGEFIRWDDLQKLLKHIQSLLDGDSI